MLSERNLSSLTIFNNHTKKRKVRDFDDILDVNTLKRVKQTLATFETQQNELRRNNKKIKIPLINNKFNINIFKI